MAIEQILSAGNFCYVIYSEKTKQAAIVDPGYSATRALSFVDDNGLTVEYVINTHYHGDHTADNGTVVKTHGAKIVASKEDGPRISGVDIMVDDGDQLMVGEITLDYLITPGHTPGGLCIIVDNQAILTGDTMFINDCGRCDMAGGSLSDMFDSLHHKIKPLPDELIVYPGHDYGPKPFDSLGNQKRTNKTLIVRTLDEFSRIP